MVYGNKLVYAYEEEVSEGKVETKKLELTFNPMTLIHYQNYTGNDFMVDFMAVNFDMSKKIRPELKEKIEKGEELNYGDITEKDVEALTSADMTKNLQFFINVTASMIATSAYPKKLAFEDIIDTLPLFLFYEDNFLSELVQLISFGLKKNKGIMAQQIARIKLH